MRDPDEGIAPDGTIVTGVDRGRVAARFEPVLDAAVAEIGDGGDISLQVYGSVATGRARAGWSDVDLLVIGMSSDDAARIGDLLSRRFSDRCRAVELSTMHREDLGGDGDEPYGNRVFLRHYCARVAGPDLAQGLPAHRADDRAARGFNGDIARHAERWRATLASAGEPVESSSATLGRRLARKTLFAVAGLVSVHDRTWTTDRPTAALRWSEIDPPIADDLSVLVAWSDGERSPTSGELARMLDGTVAHIVDRFDADIGLWGR